MNGSAASASSATNPLAVYAVNGDINNASRIFREPSRKSNFYVEDPKFLEDSIRLVNSSLIALPAARDAQEALNELAGVTLPALPVAVTPVREAFKSTEMVLLGVPPVMKGVIDLGEQATETVTELAEGFEKTFRASVMGSINLMDQLSGMIGQVAGFAPQQTVGKKRGFFSKLLGAAAPFLSFIPGVGPILSQVAGMVVPVSVEIGQA